MLGGKGGEKMMATDSDPKSEAEPNKERIIFRAARGCPSSSPHGPRKEKSGLVTQSSVTLFRIRQLRNDQAPPQNGRRGRYHEEREESSEEYRSCMCHITALSATFLIIPS